MLLQRDRRAHRLRQDQISLFRSSAEHVIAFGRVEEFVFPDGFLRFPVDDEAFLYGAFEGQLTEVDAGVEFGADVGAFVALGARDGVLDCVAGV